MTQPKIIRGWAEPTPLDLDQFHERVVAWAVKQFNDKEAHETLAGFFIFAGTGFSTIVYAPFDDPDDKYRIVASIRRMLNDPMADIVEAYAFITEAWAARPKPDEEDFDWSVPPSERDDREDIFTINTTKRDGTSKFTRFGVKTYPGQFPFMPPVKKPRLLERDDHFFDSSMTMAGVMVNFFDTLEESEKKLKKEQATMKRVAQAKAEKGKGEVK